MRTNFDFSPFRRSTVGFDRLFEMLENGGTTGGAESFPPFNLEQDGPDHYRITLAVAGFRQEEIDITAQQNLLVVSGRKQDNGERQYVHRGIATRSFERRFVLGDYVQVKGAELRDGLLSIELAREIPEAMKPRKIAIDGGTAQVSVGEQRAQNEYNEQQAAA